MPRDSLALEHCVSETPWGKILRALAQWRLPGSSQVHQKERIKAAPKSQLNPYLVSSDKLPSSLSDLLSSLLPSSVSSLPLSRFFQANSAFKANSRVEPDSIQLQLSKNLSLSLSPLCTQTQSFRTQHLRQSGSQRTIPYQSTGSLFRTSLFSLTLSTS